MRLDKYLKVAQVLKRRTVSNAVAKQNKVLVNNKIAKPAQIVKVGDLISIQFANRCLTLKVLSVTLAKGKNVAPMYEIIQTTYPDKERS